MNKRVFLVAVLIIFIMVAGFVILNQEKSEDKIIESIDAMKRIENSKPSQAMNENKQVEGEKLIEEEFMLSGDLSDVSGGNATGLAQANYAAGTYALLATFENLPDTQGTDFYEGWVVRNSPLSVVSTGKLKNKEGVYTNIFMSGTDYSDHLFYVLTLEPDDGDPAPAKHILEGTMSKKINEQ